MFHEFAIMERAMNYHRLSKKLVYCVRLSFFCCISGSMIPGGFSRQSIALQNRVRSARYH
jgi:hypothetical protein